MRKLRPCLTCGVVVGVIERTKRCKPCTRAHDAKHNSAPQRVAYRDPMYRAIPLQGECVVCNKTDDLTRDHIVPLVKGGTNDAANIRLLCRSCNSEKGELLTFSRA